MAETDQKTKAKIGRKAAETILQQPFEITAAGRKWTVDHPSVATLIMASEAISRLPDVRPDKDDIVKSTIALAPECGAVGEVAAILILGAREARRKVPSGRGPLSRLRGRTTAARRLSGELLETMSPGELYRTVAAILGRMEIADFFALTTFLSEINLLRPTKVAAGTEATASGR